MKMITAQEALQNVHDHWIKEALTLFSDQIAAINAQIIITSCSGNRSVRIEPFLKKMNMSIKEMDMSILKRYYVAKHFDVGNRAESIKNSERFNYISW